jgi:acetyl-CoA/propionyl-CoA carboxylase biotin carboxyl carrier protein
MLAKVIAHGTDRAEALDRLTAALDRTIVLGLTTNLRFLRWLVREPAVRDGQVRIDTLERIWPPDDWATRSAVPEFAWRAAARVLATVDPLRDGWRLNARPRLRVEIDGQERTVELGDGASEARPKLVRRGDTVFVDVAGRSVPVRLAPPPDVDRAARAAQAHHGTGPAELLAPMPGSVVAVHRAAGEAVEAGEPVVTLEAMKMEHVVAAPIAGVVGEVRVRPGDQVGRGQALASVEPSVRSAS